MEQTIFPSFISFHFLFIFHGYHCLLGQTHIMMEEPQLKKTSGRRKEKLRPPSHQTIPCPVSDGSDEVMIAVPVNVQDAQDRHDRVLVHRCA